MLERSHGNSILQAQMREKHFSSREILPYGGGANRVTGANARHPHKKQLMRFIWRKCHKQRHSVPDTHSLNLDRILFRAS